MEADASNIPPAQRRLRRRRWLSVLLGAIILTCGMIIGSVFTVSFLWNRVLDHIQNPEKIPARITDSLEKRLDLTPDQAQRVEQILSDRQSALLAIRAEVYPRVQLELDRAHEEVAAVLTPEQTAQWQHIFESLRDKLTLPPPGG